MSEAADASSPLTPHRVYQVFKYTVYALLCYNVVLFFREDVAASLQVFGDEVGWHNVVEAFSATFDTGAWVILLLLFELETAVIPDRLLRGGLKWLLMAIRVGCYFFIVYAFYGYWAKYVLISQTVPFAPADLCALVGGSFTTVADLDEYLPLTADSCQALAGGELLRVVGTDIIGTAEAVSAAVRLALVDIVNAGDWLLVVLILEVEVLLQIKGQLSDRRIVVLKTVKTVLYTVLLGCAIYWGIEGDFLDFWDAFLWLVAFVFIELNLFEWHDESNLQPEPDHAADNG